MKLLVLLFGWLVPPEDADGNRLARWRVTVAVFVMANTLGIFGVAALALGVFPLVFPGFVRADNIDQINGKISAVQVQQQQQIAAAQSQIAQVQVNQLDSKIIETRSRLCGAVKARAAGKPNPDLDSVIRFATERQQEELDQYWNLTRRVYRLPRCEEL